MSNATSSARTSVQLALLAEQIGLWVSSCHVNPFASTLSTVATEQPPGAFFQEKTTVPLAYVVLMTGYAALFITAIIAIAIASFQKREVG